LSAPNAPGPPSVALLLAAHGERGGSADNAGILRLVETLAARGIVAKVGAGFINGAPTIAAAVKALAESNIVVYPVFASDGYFVRVRLPQMLTESGGYDRLTQVLAPLGLDPGLPGIIGRRLVERARADGVRPEQANVILMAHGSRRDPASRLAAQALAERLKNGSPFHAVTVALLEEPPSLQQAVAGLAGPILLVGLFCGDGMHGAEDVRREIAQCGRTDIVLVANIGEFEEIDELIVAAVARWRAGMIA